MPRAVTRRTVGGYAGNVIVALDGKFVRRPADFHEMEEALVPGTKVSVKLLNAAGEETVHKPDIAKSAPFPSQRPSKGGAELAAPVANRLVGDVDAALGEQVFYVTQAQSESMAQPDCISDNLRRKTMASI